MIIKCPSCNNDNIVDESNFTKRIVYVEPNVFDIKPIHPKFYPKYAEKRCDKCGMIFRYVMEKE